MPPPPVLTPAPPVRVSEVTGAWERRLLVRPDGTRDTTTRVDWLQSTCLYVDLRQPEGAGPGPLPLDRTGHADLLRLAAQEGFAGELHASAGAFTWQRAVDLQPPTGQPDAGRLSWSGDVLVEHGRDQPYVEHWHPAPAARTPAAALLLQDEEGRHAVLVRVGPRLGWARGRPDALPVAPDLATLVAGAADLRSARALLDAEVCTGHRRTVVRSSLPLRAGTPLTVRLTGDRALTPDLRPDGTPTTRTWEVLALEGRASDLPLDEGATP